MAVKDRPKTTKRVNKPAAGMRALRDELDRLGAVARSVEALAIRQAEGSRGTTLLDLATESGIPEEALVEFAHTAGSLLQGRPLSAQAARRAATLVAAGQVWQSELGPLLSSAQVSDLLGGVSRQRVNELLRAKRLIGLHDRSGRLRFPAFKFRDGRPLDPIVSAYWTLVDEGLLDEWSAASWCVAQDEALRGRSPAEWAHEGLDAVRLAEVAHQDAARLAR
jgi:hypothetical protein